MAVGALSVSRINLAASIRLQRSALHSSFEEPDSAERPGGLLLLAVEEAEPPVAGSAPLVDGSEVQEAEEVREVLRKLPLAEVQEAEEVCEVHRTPWGKASSFFQAMACQLERFSFCSTSAAASIRFAVAERCE